MALGSTYASLSGAVYMWRDVWTYTSTASCAGFNITVIGNRIHESDAAKVLMKLSTLHPSTGSTKQTHVALDTCTVLFNRALMSGFVQLCTSKYKYHGCFVRVCFMCDEAAHTHKHASATRSSQTC